MKKTITISLDDSLLQKAAVLAGELNITRRQLIAQALAHFIDHHQHLESLKALSQPAPEEPEASEQQIFPGSKPNLRKNLEDEW